MSIRDGAALYWNNFGLKGLAAITSYRLCGLPKEITERPKGFAPVHLRVAAADVSIYSLLFQNEYDFALPFAPKVIVDAGANIGMASIYFARRYPEARIISIEAEPSNFRMLEKNVHSYPQITPVHAALWNQNGEISVGSPEGNTAETAFVTSETITGQRVRATTVPTIMREFGIEEIDLLKVDIEGAEKEVFECCDWASKVRCLMVETHDRFRPGSSCAVDSAMRDFMRSQRGETTFYLSNGPKRANVEPARSHD